MARARAVTSPDQQSRATSGRPVARFGAILPGGHHVRQPRGPGRDIFLYCFAAALIFMVIADAVLRRIGLRPS